MFNWIRELRQATWDWLNGVNICPRGGAVHYLMTFGRFKKLCPDCFLGLKDQKGTVGVP